MKKIVAFACIGFSILLSSCNDGEMVYKDIDFSGVTSVSRCSNTGAEKVFYKLKQDEALILIVDADNLMRDESKQAVNVEIDGTNTSLEYRKYDDKVSNTSICNVPAPAFPNAVQQIPASPGASLTIRRDIAMVNNESEDPLGNNSVSLTYQYTFLLENINFQEGETNIKYDRMPFGTNNYASRSLAFKFINSDATLKEVNLCNNTLIALADKEAMLLSVLEGDLPNDATDTPKIIPLNEERKLIFRQYKRTGINLINVCENEGDIPGTSEGNINQLEELWTSKEGEVEIASRWTNPGEGLEPKLVHTINLKNVVFTKQQYEQLTFKKTNITFGEYKPEE